MGLHQIDEAARTCMISMSQLPWPFKTLADLWPASFCQAVVASRSSTEVIALKLGGSQDFLYRPV